MNTLSSPALRSNLLAGLAFGFAFAFTTLAPQLASAQESVEPVSVGQVELSNTFENHRAVDPGTSFNRSAGRLYASVQVLNPSRTETNVRIEFRATDGSRRAGIQLSVPARARYRTLARFNTAHPPGAYEIVVLSAEGEVISTTALTITE